MRLTLPAVESGTRRVQVDGQTVGHVLGRYYGWEACLWRRVDVRGYDTVVAAPTVTELRAKLRHRLAERGPWWDE